MTDHTVRAYDEDLSQLKMMLAQMGGLVEQQLDDAIDALFAGFPAGTVSGAPKVHACEIIAQLEPETRGAYAGGVGGSMLWFGSSAGVALSNMYPEARSAVQWVKHGWHVPVGYVAGFAVIMLVLGWHPDTGHKKVAAPVAVEAPVVVPAPAQ